MHEQPPAMIQIAGPNGCGKTTLYKKLLEPYLSKGGLSWNYINADDIEREMRNSDDSTSLGLDKDLSIQAREEADWQREQLLKPGNEMSFVFETVFSDDKGRRLEYMQKARVAGYYVVLIFVSVRDVNLSAERVMQRVFEGGHDVPIATQIARFDRVLINAKKAICIADLCLFLDNSNTNTNASVSHEAVGVFKSGILVETTKSPPKWFTEMLI